MIGPSAHIAIFVIIIVDDLIIVFETFFIRHEILLVFILALRFTFILYNIDFGNRRSISNQELFLALIALSICINVIDSAF